MASLLFQASQGCKSSHNQKRSDCERQRKLGGSYNYNWEKYRKGKDHKHQASTNEGKEVCKLLRGRHTVPAVTSMCMHDLCLGFGEKASWRTALQL